MTDAEIKNAIARCALSGVSEALARASNGSIRLYDCDLCVDGSPPGLSRSVQMTLYANGETWPRVFEFTVKEIYQ